MCQSFIALAFLASMLSLNVSAQDLKAGEAVWKKYNCASCHGDDAKTPVMNSYPVLAGQHAKYLSQSLFAYQRAQAGAPATSNIRKNAVMGALASTLSAQDVEAVSAWLATLETPLSNKR